jgi:excinuclease ABC subunit A
MHPDDLAKLSHKEFILVKNARQNNLKGVSLAIPQRKMVVITGVSGSGKSSLAFDTLYAEGQRRYVESLSSYIRQFMGKVNKPKVDYIKGLSPAIAIQQKVNTTNPRSTVGTTTEIYDYMKLLFSRIGQTYSPISGEVVQRHSVEDVVDFVQNLKVGTKVQIIAPLVKNESRTWKEELNILLQKGFSRVIIDNENVQIEHLIRFFETGEIEPEIKSVAKKSEKLLNEGFLLIDRISANKDDDDNRSRIADSVQTAFFEGHGQCFIDQITENGSIKHSFNDRFELDGMNFELPSVNLFSFNNPYGTCPKCEGFGEVIGIDQSKVIPDPNLSVFDDVVVPWKGEAHQHWKGNFLKKASKFDFPIHRSVNLLTKEEKDFLWKGNKEVEGINDFFAHAEAKTYQIQYRILLSRYKGKTFCPECEGTRLRKEATYVKINGFAITDLVNLPCKDLLKWFQDIKLNPKDTKIAERLLLEVVNRLLFLNEVGLGYLTINRSSKTLSGGESQRIQLVTSLGSTLTGSLYILDEPSIGLHSKDTERLIEILKKLQALGNSVIIVEHDEDVIKSADQIIDVGPYAGTLGGEIIFQGTLKEILKSKESLTGKYLTGVEEVPIPLVRRSNKPFLKLNNAYKNNLKDVSINIPIGAMTVVTGVSGSGKSTLVRDVLYPMLQLKLEGRPDMSSATKLAGAMDRIKRVEYVDQNPIGKSSRSNPVTYLKAFDSIRELYSSQPLAKARGYTPGNFSFNVEGGRCEICKGEGIQTVEMQFMADIQVLCESCGGKRYKVEIQEVLYKEKSISDVLEMTVHDALIFFEKHPDIIKAMSPLKQVGLDYLTLGQPSIHLSGGEAQRIKLASFLVKSNAPEPILFIFDEPTTGLHFHDIKQLLNSFYALIDNGHTVVIIEHNMDVIKCADWVIDLGPEGGNEGGNLVFEGLPEDLINVKESYTGKYLQEKLVGIEVK